MKINTKKRLYHLPAKLEIGTLTAYSSVIERPYEIMEFQYDQYEKLEDSINKMFNEKPIQYNFDKKKYANEIIVHINKADIYKLDLHDRLPTLVKIIRNWNN